MGLGPNVAIDVRNISEGGARITVKNALTVGQEIEVNLCGLGHRRAVKLTSRVIWCTANEDGTFQVGLSFGKNLPYIDLQELTQ
jgi:hypothetical protein